MPLRLFFCVFQAEDGIRDYKVTGVQTCALPICPAPVACRVAVFRTDPPPILLLRRSEEHTSELQSPCNLVCRLLLEKKVSQQSASERRWAWSRTVTQSPRSACRTASRVFGARTCLGAHASFAVPSFYPQAPPQGFYPSPPPPPNGN